MKVKIFELETAVKSDVQQKQINNWLTENSQITISFITQSQSNSYCEKDSLTISIWYE